MTEATKTFKCEVVDESCLTVVIPAHAADPIQVSVGKIGDLSTHRAVYLDRGMVTNLIRFLST